MNEQLKIIISAEVSKVKKGVEDAKKQVKSFQEQVQKASKDVDSNFKAIGDGMAAGAKAAGTALVAVGAALLALGASTQEYRNEQAKLITAFEAAGGSANEAKETYNDLYRVLGDSGQATEAASHLAKLTTEEKALSEWTTICQGVYATFGDSLPIEGLTEAANETAKVGTVTGSLADALNWAGISEDDFNEKLAATNSEAEREQLIRETLNRLYEDAASKYEENNAQVLAQNEAQAKLNESMAALGEAVAPVVTAFTQFGAEALAVVTPYIQQLADQYMPKLSEVLGVVAESLGAAMSFVADNFEILAVIGGVIAGITAAITLYNVVAAVKAAMDAAQVTTLGALIAAYLAQAAAMAIAIAPYVLIVAAIAAVIAIIVTCIKHWDKIQAGAAKAWDAIKRKTSETTKNVINKFNEWKEKASQKVEELKQKVTEKTESLKQSAVDKFNSLKTSATAKIEGLKSSVTSGFSNMVSTVKSKASSIVSAASEKFNSMKSKVKTAIDGARDALRSGIDKMKSFFNFSWELPKIKLPHFSISGSFSLNPPSIPSFSVSWYKLGGVFDKATLFPYGGGSIGGLGEDGAEAIVPLEKNTKWLDRLASMLADKQGGNRPVYLMVDKTVLGKVSAEGINDITRMTGKVPIKVM